MVSSTLVLVLMGNSGPKISTFITLDSPVTFLNSFGAARGKEADGNWKSIDQNVLILLYIQKKTKYMYEVASI